jgi:type IV pilus assembly protein PilQ
VGWVCAGSAIGEETPPTLTPQDEAAAEVLVPASPTIRIAGEDTEPESLFPDVGNHGEEDQDLPVGQTVAMTERGQIELHVENQEITKILKLLSLQAQRNIIASRNVAGVVSADLYEVDFYEAIEAVLHANGFGYRERGNFIYVYTAEELATMEQVERRRITRVRRLNYISAADASTFVTPLLSEQGSIALNGETPSGITVTAGDVGGNRFAFADTLVIHDYEDNVNEILALINELDVRPPQVLVEATVLEVRLTEANAFGTDLSIVLDNGLDIFPTPLSVVDDIIDGVVPDGDTSSFHQVYGSETAFQSTPGNVASGDASIKMGVVTENVSVFVRALDRVTDSTIIARPKVMVLNRQRADLLVGARLGYLSTTATETSTTQTVEFLDVGTQLTVLPDVKDDGFIRLAINPSISDGTTSSIDGQIIPNETTSEFISDVMVRSGQTVVLGGLFKEDTIITREQVPGLGDMPLIGAGFKGHDDSVRRSEVIFLITPTIVRDEPMFAAGERAADSVEVQSMAARTGLLPWSRSKKTAQHLRDATRYYDQGEHDRALLAAKMALSLEPNNNEAVRLRERITNDRERMPTRGVLDDAIDVLVDQQRQQTRAEHFPAEQPAAVVPPVQSEPAAEPVATADMNAGAIATDDAAAMPVDIEAQRPTVYHQPISVESADEEQAASPSDEAALDPVNSGITEVPVDAGIEDMDTMVFNSFIAPTTVRVITALDEPATPRTRAPSPELVEAMARWLPRSRRDDR